MVGRLQAWSGAGEERCGGSAAGGTTQTGQRFPLRAPLPAAPHRFFMKYIIIAISRLMARYLVACTLVLSYTLTASRRLPSLGHTAL